VIEGRPRRRKRPPSRTRSGSCLLVENSASVIGGWVARGASRGRIETHPTQGTEAARQAVSGRGLLDPRDVVRGPPPQAVVPGREDRPGRRGVVLQPPPSRRPRQSHGPRPPAVRGLPVPPTDISRNIPCTRCLQISGQATSSSRSTLVGAQPKRAPPRRTRATSAATNYRNHWHRREATEVAECGAQPRKGRPPTTGDVFRRVSSALLCAPSTRR
jgi:hypothetical protein